MARVVLYVVGIVLWASGFVITGAVVVHHQNQLDAAAPSFLRPKGPSDKVAITEPGTHHLARGAGQRKGAAQCRLR